MVIVPATGGRGFSRSGVQEPLFFSKISGIATGESLHLRWRTDRRGTMVKADIELLVPELNCFSDNDNDGITLLTYF